MEYAVSYGLSDQECQSRVDARATAGARTDGVYAGIGYTLAVEIGLIMLAAIFYASVRDIAQSVIRAWEKEREEAEVTEL